MIPDRLDRPFQIDGVPQHHAAPALVEDREGAAGGSKSSPTFRAKSSPNQTRAVRGPTRAINWLQQQLTGADKIYPLLNVKSSMPRIAVAIQAGDLIHWLALHRAELVDRIADRKHRISTNLRR
jgi:hypothetical protein